MFNPFKIFKKRKALVEIKKVEPPTEEKRLKIAYTVYPDEKLEYNEFWKRIYEEAKKR